MEMAVIILILAVLAIFGFYYFTFSCYYKKRVIDDIPTSKTRGVFIGLVELKGTARTPEPLVSYLTGGECFHYTWDISEHWERWVTETYTDSDGKLRTRQKLESGWTTVDSGGSMQPFELHDEEGFIVVHPERAKITGVCVMDETVGRSHPLYYEKGPAGSIMDSTHKRRFTETIFPHGHDVYLLGYSCLPDGADRPVIAHSPDAPMYLISTQNEEKVASGYGCLFKGMLIFGTILAAIPLFCMIQQGAPREQCLVGLIPLGIYLFLCFLCWAYVTYMSLVMIKNRVLQGLSNLDVELKRRHDLIPNLVRAVSGMKDHELDTQTLLAALRAEHYHAGDAQRELGGDSPTGMAVQPFSPALMAVVERYPELTANENFVRLQRELQNTENKIALARAYYNDIATNYNTRLEVFPDALVAALCGLKAYRLLNEE